MSCSLTNPLIPTGTDQVVPGQLLTPPTLKYHQLNVMVIQMTLGRLMNGLIDL